MIQVRQITTRGGLPAFQVVNIPGCPSLILMERDDGLHITIYTGLAPRGDNTIIIGPTWIRVLKNENEAAMELLSGCIAADRIDIVDGDVMLAHGGLGGPIWFKNLVFAWPTIRPLLKDFGINIF